MKIAEIFGTGGYSHGGDWDYGGGYRRRHHKRHWNHYKHHGRHHGHHKHRWYRHWDKY